MVKMDREITSTERLLEIIRGKKVAGSEKPKKDSAPSFKKVSMPVLKFTPFSQKVTVGVDIGYQSLRMAKVLEVSDNQWKLLDCKSVPLPRAAFGSFEFTNFLKAELTKFCGSSKKIKVWSLIPSSKVDVRFIKIPKVPKKQVENAVYWTVKKEITLDDSETLLDYEVQGEVTEQGVQKMSAMVYTAPKSDIQDIRDIFQDAGFGLSGLTVAPFAIQNLFRTGWIPVSGDLTASLHIGKDWSRIDIYSKGSLILTRGIKAGLSSMVESLVERLEEQKKRGTASSSEPDKGINLEKAHKLVMSLSPGAPPLSQDDFGYQFKEEEIFEMIRPALERLVRQVERTFANVGAEKVGKVYIAGVVNGYKPLVDYVGDQLGIESSIMDPFAPDVPYLLDALIPSSVSERVAFSPAVGLALSSNSRTPNLTFTYKEKEKMVQVARVNRGVLLAVLAMVAVGAGVLYWQGHLSTERKATLAVLEKELGQYNPRIDKNFVLQIAAKVKEEQKLTRTYSNRYLGMSVVSELSALTPPHVRLLRIRGDLGPVAGIKREPPKEGEKDAPKDPGGSLEIEGIVTGERKSLENLLSSYVLRLQSSPIFKETRVQNSKVESYQLGKGESEVLHFNVLVKLI